MAKKLMLNCMLIGLVLLGSFISAARPVVGATPWSWSASYSLRDEAQLQVGYQLNKLLGFDLAYRQLGTGELAGNRWQGRVFLKPLEGVDFQVGYDFTGEHYLVGGQAQLPLNENLEVVSKLNTIIPGDDAAKYVDYLFGLRIGIGYNHYLLAGAQELYRLGTEHEPELFVELDMNWRLPNDFGIRFQPHVAVEGEFNHKTTVFKEWENKLLTGIFFGQDQEARWDVGIYAQY